MASCYPGQGTTTSTHTYALWVGFLLYDPRASGATTARAYGATSRAPLTGFWMSAPRNPAPPNLQHTTIASFHSILPGICSCLSLLTPLSQGFCYNSNQRYKEHITQQVMLRHYATSHVASCPFFIVHSISLYNMLIEFIVYFAEHCMLAWNCTCIQPTCLHGWLHCYHCSD